MKKILAYLLVAVIIIGVIGAVIYFLTRGNSQPGNQTGQAGSLPSSTLNGGTAGQAAGGTLPAGSFAGSGTPFTATGVSNIIGTVPALDYFVDNRNNAVVIEPDGTVAGIANNNTDIISSSKIQNIISAAFSYDGAKLLVSFGDARDPQTSVFDINTKSWMALPTGMVSPRWSPADDRIAYLRSNANGTATLATLDASKTKNNITAVATLHVQDISLLWPSKNRILFYDRPSIYADGSVWSFDLQKKSLTPVIIGQRGLETIWSNTTTTMGLAFIGNASQYGGQLQLVDGFGNTIEQLRFLTLPPKCLFSMFSASQTASGTAQAASAGNTSTTAASSTVNPPYLALYCGVPRDQNALSSTRLPDDYEMGSLFTSDNIYRINTASGNIDTLFDDQSQNVDVSDMKIFNNALFFINRYDQKIYSIAL